MFGSLSILTLTGKDKFIWMEEVMTRKRRSVKPATFALAMSTLGPAWATRLETQSSDQNDHCKRGMFKLAPRCHEVGGVFATILCLVGLSI